MKIKNFNDYKESLKFQEISLYIRGEKVKDRSNHPMLIPHINSAGKTYELVNDPQYENLLTANSHLSNNKISRFTHIHQSVEDLLKKVQMLRLVGQKTGSCFQRCVGFDGLNSVYTTTYEIDEKYKTDYHQRFKNYLSYIQEENLMVIGAMTDAKGDRNLRPIEQKDKDMYLHLVEKKDNGIIVRGAKLHQTGAANSHEVLVMPTLGMKDDEKDFAISFALPLNTKGISLVFGRQVNDTRRLEHGIIDAGNPKFASVGGECLIIFDDVFVPYERVFMLGENEFTGILVDRFASAHRCNYGCCKVGIADVLIGATALIAEYQNTDKASHIRDKITEMIHLSETLHASSIASASYGIKTKSSAYIVHPLYANITKQNVTRFIYEIGRLSHDIAGGFVATIPSEADLKNKEVGKFVEKYFKAKDEISAECRIKVGRLIESLTGPTSLIETMQGAGSPQAQRIMILRQGDIEAKKKLVKEILDI